ncbi:MAG TPA: dihydroorotase [Negativicutes bacterium]|jgi:dihydroorotase
MEYIDWREPSAGILLKNGWIIDPAQKVNQAADILLWEGKISQMGVNLPANDVQVFDCTGLWIMPGLIDAHCHLREPGAEHKETIETGTSAAACGGFTTVIAMANVNPVPDNLNTYNKIQKIIQDKAIVRVIQAASVTRDLRGRELCDMATLTASGVKIFSDDGQYIERAAILYQALQLASKLGVYLSLHEEDSSLKSYWPTAYDPLSEAVAITRDLEVLRVTGGKVHFQHISTARGVALIRSAKREGLTVTAEACPHHLTLTVADVAAKGTNAKMAPPLRTHEDIKELINGLHDGTIDLIATDHAPHAADDKNTAFDIAANGIIGFETALPVLLTKLVFEQGLSPAWLIERMSCQPAKVFGLPGGTLALGAPADVCVIDPRAEWTIDSTRFVSKTRNTPYHGMNVKGRVVLTFVNGHLVYEGRSELH